MDLDLGRRSIVEWAEEAPRQGASEFTPARDRFSVETSIGRGGMGEIFLVTDRDLKRRVAMKVLRSDVVQGREQRLHFVAEAQATSQLEHPGIPPVHDIGLTSDGQPYFTMKLVRGRTLREIIHDLVLQRPEVRREYTTQRSRSGRRCTCSAQPSLSSPTMSQHAPRSRNFGRTVSLKRNCGVTPPTLPTQSQ